YYRLANGYAAINRNGRLVVASRLICEMINGEPASQEMEAAHSCGRGCDGCINPRHLSWKTRTENANDKIEHGTLPLGERHKSSKLTEREVLETRRIRAAKPQRKIAAMFKISQAQVGRILRRQV